MLIILVCLSVWFERKWSAWQGWKQENQIYCFLPVGNTNFLIPYRSRSYYKLGYVRPVSQSDSLSMIVMYGYYTFASWPPNWPFYIYCIYYVLKYVFLSVSLGSNSTQYFLHQCFASFSSANPIFLCNDYFFNMQGKGKPSVVVELYLIKCK